MSEPEQRLYDTYVDWGQPIPGTKILFEIHGSAWRKERWERQNRAERERRAWIKTEPQTQELEQAEEELRLLREWMARFCWCVTKIFGRRRRSSGLLLGPPTPQKTWRELFDW